MEIGWVWRNGVLFGIDGHVGKDGDNDQIGGGLSLGKEFDLWNQMQLVIGGSMGFWGVSGVDEYSANFLAPFVKLRWKSFEITNRGLLGIYDNRGKRNGKYYDDQGFGYNSHQLMAGFHFGGRKAR